MLWILWTERRTNKSIIEQLIFDKRLIDKAKSQNLSYFGHVVRGERLERDVMLGMGNSGHSRTSPKIKWIDGILASTELSLAQSIEMTRSRDVWRFRYGSFSTRQHQMIR